jgi:two-component system sensor kinase FixL
LRDASRDKNNHYNQTLTGFYQQVFMKQTGDQAETPRYLFIWIGVLFGLGYWLIDMLVDVLVFNEGTLRSQLLHPVAAELMMRLSFLVLSSCFGIFASVTLQRQQTACVRAYDAEMRLQVLLDSAAEYIFLINLEGAILRANQSVFRDSGFTPDEMMGHHIKDFFSSDSQQLCECSFPALRERGFNRAEIEFVRKDGSVINMECSATAVPDQPGVFSTFLIIQHDITDRLQAARRLEDSERRFRAIFNSTYQFIGLLDPQGTTLEANQTALDFIGQSNADVVGRKFWETPWWNHSVALQEQLKTAISEAASGKLVRFEARHLGKQGEQLIIDFSLKPVLNDQGETVMIIPEGHNITERKLAEEKLKQMQQDSAHMMRVSTMGEMASGMAHELNQPLTALLSYCGTALQLAQQAPSLPAGFLDILERATEQAHRAGKVIRHLRDFVSKGKNEKTCVVLNELVQDVIDLIGWELRETDIQIVFQQGSTNGEIFVDRIQIEQVLINLIKNSVEAIRNAGIEAGRVEITSQFTEANTVELTVIDNGPGISAGIAGVLFDPYQTSKESGMGMGLSISRSIVEAHNGKLWVDKNRSRGAMFCMSLPGCR